MIEFLKTIPLRVSWTWDNIADKWIDGALVLIVPIIMLWLIWIFVKGK